LKKECNASINFNTVVDIIKETRPQPHKNKPIFPFKILPGGLNVITREAKIMLDSNCTNPSDPNSIKDMGPTVYAMPEEINIKDIHEEFSQDGRDRDVHTE